jgi:hypothetical protein
MLVTNHVLSGALIGAVTRRPVTAFALGAAAHFALDAVPHWGDWRSRRQFLKVAAADGLCGLAVMAALAAVAPPESRAAMVAGMAGAALPDLDKPSGVFFGCSPLPRAMDDFHARIQDESRSRWWVEAAAAAGLTAATLGLLSARARG